MCHLGPASRTEGSFYMSGMRGMLCIALYLDVSSHHEPNEKGGLPLGTPPSLNAVPLSFSSLREESSVAWRDAQYASHVAHVKTTPPFWMPAHHRRADTV